MPINNRVFGSDIPNKVKKTLEAFDEQKAEELTGDKFDEAFKNWDTDGNGVLQKSEMADFILGIFNS